MSRVSIATGLLSIALLSGCTTAPMGPTALVMPAPGKPFDVFAQDQAMCKQFAGGEVDGGATMSNVKQLGTLAVSAALGGGLGEAVRGNRGAEVGGAVGAIAGGATATRGSAHDQTSLQGRYDLAYVQCMYSRGNQIAGAARTTPRVAYAPSAGRGYPPQDATGGPGRGPGPTDGQSYAPPVFNPSGMSGIH